MSKDGNVEGQTITAHVHSTAGNFIGNIQYGEHFGEGWLRIDRACAFAVENGRRHLNPLGWIEVNKMTLMSIRAIQHDTALYQDYIQKISGLMVPTPEAMASLSKKQ